MRKLFLTILAFATASSLLIPAFVFADILERSPGERRHTRAARLHTSQDPNDPDTIWIGHVWNSTWAGKTGATNNPPYAGNPATMPAGGYGPYHVGRGPNRVRYNLGSPDNAVDGLNGVWDFDHFQADEKDSLQGWWPVARPAQRGSTTFQDWKRAHQGLDYGNNVNYVINEGGPVDANGNKRTFGIVGLWHRDQGNAAYSGSDTLTSVPTINVQPVKWSPTEVGLAGSTGSAWCGLRSHGDLSVRDRVDLGGTGNYINADMLNFQGGAAYSETGSTLADGTDHNFPGYCSQLDQMLYRDVKLAEAQGLNISFRFRSNMSLAKQPGTADNPVGRAVGWFNLDPVSPCMDVGYNNPTNDGNFISANEAGITAGAPCDSFMVYVGAPVNDNNVYFSAPLFVNGVEISTVYDKKRRWFTEVIRSGFTDPINGCAGGVGPCTGGGKPQGYKEIATFAGVIAPTTVTCNFGTIAAYQPILKKIKDADGNTSDGGTVRIVFRVKTNRGYDDENTGVQGFDSGTRGAVVLDNVVVNAWAAAEGNFENTEPGDLGVIDNRTSVPATAAWKSTGKPPAVYWHTHDVSTLTFSDPCGGLTSPGRQCNLIGKILTAGDHDVAGEKCSGVFNTNLTDRQKWIASPVINLRATANGVYNSMGIDLEGGDPEGDYQLYWDLYNAQFVNATTETGNFFSVGWQSYPARQANGNVCWGETNISKFISFYTGNRFCADFMIDGAKVNNFIKTTNPNNKPDSLRIFVQQSSVCYNVVAAFTVANCGPTTPTKAGAYFDNLSLAITDGASPPAMAINFQTLINDAFPANGDNTLIPAGFDTCAAQMRNAQLYVTGPGRPSICGDTVVVTANDEGTDTRLDMIFRIKPGVGNYFIVGNRASGVAKRADGGATAGSPPARAKAVAGDGSFWGTYMANPGLAAMTKGDHHGGVSWDENTWNQARCDTAEANLFPFAGNEGAINLHPGVYASMYEETDAHLAALSNTITVKNRCLQDAGGVIKCDNSNVGLYGGTSGLPNDEAGTGTKGQTKEYTPILPDGLLTPGAHVEYFFRKSEAPAGLTKVHLAADTTIVVNQTAVQGFDADFHRWHEFSILPDRWKSNEWASGDQDAGAPACMLYLDFDDRRGDEGVWVGIADTIGATAGAYVGGVPTGRWGAHNGWHARGDQDITVDISTDPSIAVYAHRGQPGTIWDMYGVKGIESNTTSAGFSRRSTPDPTGDQTGKKDLISPSGLMLRNYYRMLLILTGDIFGDIGPYSERQEDDIGTIQDFVFTATGSDRPRAVWVMGRDFVDGQVNGGSQAHPTFPTTFFGAGLVSGNYRNLTGNPNDILDLVTYSPHATSPAQTYGVFDPCVAITNDVLSEAGSGFTATKALRYSDYSTFLNNYASIYGVSTYGTNNNHPFVSLVDGFRITSLGSQGTLQTRGANLYFWDTITNIFGSFNCPLSAGQPVGVGDIPGGVNFLALRSENPFRGDMAKISFGITRKEKVELNVYDVSGRLVKTLANREFEAGSHDLFWDGSNNDGQLVSRGVYFYQLRTPSFVSQKKLAVLKN